MFNTPVWFHFFQHYIFKQCIIYLYVVLKSVTCCSQLDALLCLVTLDFILQYKEWRMYHLLILFASKNGFIFINC